MKKVLLITLSVLLLLGVLIMPIVAIIMAPVPDDHQLQPYVPATRYDSVAEFEAADVDADRYYIPSTLPEGYSFHYIDMREDVYIAFAYTIDAAAIDTDGLSSYGIERMTSLICEYNLYEDGSIAINGSFIPNGYKPVEYQGRTLYRYDEYDLEHKDGKAVTSDRLIGYSVAFLEDGYCIYMHLPAVDTFENMLKYTDLIKVNID